jgi:hypothetical protein
VKRFYGASMLVAFVALAVAAGAAVAQGVDVSAFEPRVSATPGEYVSVALSLTYHGTVSEAVEVVVQAPGPGWTFLSDRKRVTLEPEIPKTVFMTFMPPADLPAGEIVVRFRALSVVQGLDVGGTEVRLTITPHTRLVVTAPGSTSLAPGDAATYTFVVRNEGNTPVTASVRVQTELESADRDGEIRMQLVAGETRPFPVTVRVPTEGAPQTARIVVDACVLPEGAVCARGVLLLDILPPGPDAVPGIPPVYLPSKLSIDLSQAAASGLFQSHGDLPSGESFDVAMTFGAVEPIISSFAAAVSGLLHQAIGLSVQRSETSWGCGVTVETPIGVLDTDYVDDYGVQTPGRVVAARMSGQWKDLSWEGWSGLSSTQVASSLAMMARARVLALSDGSGGFPISAEATAESRWTGPGFRGPDEDTWSYFASVGIQWDESVSFSASRFWGHSDVFGVATIKGREWSADRFVATVNLNWASLRFENARRSQDWEPLPVEGGWREKRDWDTSRSLGFDVGFGGFRLCATSFAGMYQQDGVRDDDGDGLFDEDPVDGVDNDGDGKIDEDGPNADQHSVDDLGLSFSYASDGLYLEIRCADSTAWAPGKETPVDEHHRVGVLVRRPLSATILGSLSAIAEDGEWAQQVDVSYAPEGRDLTATARLRLAWSQVSPGVFEPELWLGVQVEWDFLLVSPIKALGQVAGTVFVDDNGNGVRDAGEVGVPDVVLEMGGGRARTGEAGDYRLPAVKPGVYTLKLLALPANLRAGQTSTIVALEAGKVSSVDFALRAVGTVSGGVFADSNQNGAWDDGEVGIPGAVVILGSGADAQSARTNANGLFTFVGLVPGRYDVGLAVSSLPARWRPTTPAQVQVELGVGGEAAVAFGGHESPREVAFTFRSSTLTFDVARPQGGGPWSREFTADPGASYGGETSFTWDFDGDADADAVGRIVTYTFPGSGRYVVTLTANGGDRVAKILDILDNEP